MALQQHVDNLKQRPKDERQVVAVGFAGAVVIILIVIWGFYFLKSLRHEQIMSGGQFEIPAETGASVPVTQTYQAYDTSPQQDQFGLPQ